MTESLQNDAVILGVTAEVKFDAFRNEADWRAARNMPALDHIFNKNILNLTLNMVFGGSPAVMATPIGKVAFTNVVRLVDKALREYEAARLALRDFEANAVGNLNSPLFVAVDHFENCLDALNRAFLYLVRMKSDANTPVTKADMPNKNERNRVSAVRHSIQHLDERAARGRMVGEHIFLNLRDRDFMELEGNRITYAELAGWIESLHGVMERLMTAK